MTSIDKDNAEEVDVPDFVKQGKLLVVQRQYAEAVKLCRLGLLSEPGCVKGRLILAMALMALGRYDEVLAEMRVALDADDENAMAYLLRGEALLHKRRFQRARDALLVAYDLDPNNEKIQRLLDEIEAASTLDAGGLDPAPTSTKVYPSSAARSLRESEPSAISDIFPMSDDPHFQLDDGDDDDDDWRTRASEVDAISDSSNDASSWDKYAASDDTSKAVISVSEIKRDLDRSEEPLDSSRTDLSIKSARQIYEQTKQTTTEDIGSDSDFDVDDPDDGATDISHPLISEYTQEENIGFVEDVETVAQIDENSFRTPSQATSVQDLNHSSASGEDALTSGSERVSSEESKIEGVALEHDADLLDAPTGDLSANFDASTEGATGGASFWDQAEIDHGHEGTKELSLDALEILDEMPPVPPEEENQSAMPPIPPEEENQSAMPPIPNDSVEEFAPYHLAEESGEISGATRVRFSGESDNPLASGPIASHQSDWKSDGSMDGHVDFRVGKASSINSEEQLAHSLDLNPPKAIDRTAALSEHYEKLEPRHFDSSVAETALGRPDSKQRKRKSSQDPHYNTLDARPINDPYIVDHRQGDNRTSWVVLMLGSPGKQRWKRASIAIGIVFLALIGGFLVRYLRIGHQVDSKRNDALALLEKGNLSDYRLAAKRYQEIAKSKSEKKAALAARARILAAIPFHFGEKETIVKIKNAFRSKNADQAMLSVYEQLSLGHLHEADQIAFQLRGRFPKNATIYYLSGRIMMLRGKSDVALTLLKRATKFNTKNAVFQCALGDILSRMGKDKEATKAYRAALAINPNHIASWLSYIKLDLKKGELDSAKKKIDRLKNEFIKFASRGEKAWIKALNARLFIVRGKIADAKKLIENALEVAPMLDPVFYDYLASSYLKISALKKSEKMVHRSETVMKGRDFPKVLKARILLEQGRVKAAWKTLMRVLSADANCLKAEIQLARGQTDEAERTIAQIKRKEKSNLCVERLETIALIKKGSLDESEALLKKQLSKQSNQFGLLLLLSEVLLKKANYVEAKKYINDAKKINPESIKLLIYLSDIWISEGQFNLAYQKLISKSKENSWYLPLREKLARLEIGANHLEEAEKQLKKLVKLEPQNGYAKLLLIQSYTKRNLYRKANAYLRRIAGGDVVFVNLEKGRLALEERNLDKAKDYLRLAMEAGNPEGGLLLVQAFINSDQLAAADAVVAELMKRFPKHSEPFEAKGRVLLMQAKAARAGLAFEQALATPKGHALMPVDRARIIMQIGKAFQYQSKISVAIDRYRQAQKICERCPFPYFQEGLALDEDQKSAEAISAVKKAISLNPRMPTFYYELGKIYTNTGQNKAAIGAYENFLKLSRSKDLTKEVRQTIEDLKLEE